MNYVRSMERPQLLDELYQVRANKKSKQLSTIK